MIKPNWELFKSKFNDNPTYDFEYLCYLLFCIEYDKPQGIFRYKNQAGIEWEPINIDGKTIVAQCKFYDTSLGSNKKDDILKMLDTIQKKYPTPCELKFYTNQDWRQGQQENTNDSKPKIEIKNKAEEYGITIDWRTNEAYFLSPDVAFNQDLMKHFFTNDSIYDLVYNKQLHTQNILKDIHTHIDFKSQKIEIDRTNEINQIETKLKNYQALIISGVGGVGKTAIIKKLYEESNNDIPLYLFKASEFETNQIDNLFSIYSLQKFIDVHTRYDLKIVVIDSAEKILDLNNRDPFKEFVSALLSNQWKILFTTRYIYLDDLNNDLQQNLQIIPYKIDIQNLSTKALNDIASKYHFVLPQDEKLFELLKNPFELKDYLSLYTGEEIDYQTFKTKVWNHNIKKSNPQRELCFLKLVSTRVNKGQFYVNIECNSNALEELRIDGILGYETAGYFITHDKYEEWGLAHIIEKEFIKRRSDDSFFGEIGSSLPIRRAFRSWVSEKLLINGEAIQNFVENAIDSEEIKSFWKDEIFVSILLSEHSQRFFEQYNKELKANDFELLKRIAFLLQIACKEVDGDIWEQSGIHISELKDARYIFTQPKGSGWQSFVVFAYENIHDIKLKNINHILPILYDWNLKNKQGDTTRLASMIALQYYKWINQEKSTYRYDEYIEKICNIVISGTSEIQKELAYIFDNIVENKWKSNRGNYYKLSTMILSTSHGLPRAYPILQHMPTYVLKLADLFWTKLLKEEENNQWDSYQSDEIEDAYGIDNIYELRYFPSSAYQTPIYYLLRLDFSHTINFILNFVNLSVEHYAKSGWEHQKEIGEIDVVIDGKIYKQYHSLALWNIYRGTSSPISPYLLQSIHMALEKYLLEIAKLLDSDILESWLMYLLKNSKSSSISAIITSIILAYPDKTFNIAKILFEVPEFIRTDFMRKFEDDFEVKSLYSIGMGLNNSYEVYTKERLQTCEEAHRQRHLESLFLNYQLFRTGEVSEEDADKRQKVLWKILDNYYSRLPSEQEQSESDKNWRIALSRMDKRKMDIEAKKVEKGVELTFNAQLPSELKEYSEQTQKESQKSNQYTSLYLWSLCKIEDTPDYKNYKKYEENPLLALNDIKKVIEIPHEKRDFIFQYEIFPNVSVLLLRDHESLLLQEDIELCKDIIFEFATLPFQKNYNYQLSDGVKTAISNLPILIQ